ncbi:hypothetical protein NECAME_14377 [Necator americanus]|uniref:Uncharacterized protein n=1 Tax=Necator americanus TaxID=51031 RepID=W2SN24_NECAM|nr:hypothetical protein NECAME_14377 [Necator americanus]ETN71055.1 hypothetical protein NECAME_14377 [Necator americanus]
MENLRTCCNITMTSIEPSVGGIKAGNLGNKTEDGRNPEISIRHLENPPNARPSVEVPNYCSVRE